MREYIVYHYVPDWIARKNGLHASYGAVRHESPAAWDSLPASISDYGRVYAQNQREAIRRYRAGQRIAQ